MCNRKPRALCPTELCALCPAFRSGRLRPGWQLRRRTHFQPFLKEWQSYRSNCTWLLSILSAPSRSASQSRSATQNRFLSPSTLAFHVACTVKILIKPLISNYASFCIFNLVNKNCGSVGAEKLRINLEWPNQQLIEGEILILSCPNLKLHSLNLVLFIVVIFVVKIAHRLF